MNSSTSPSDRPFYDLASFSVGAYQPGRGILVRTLWYYCSLLLFESGWFPLCGIKLKLLRLFGAKIGTGVTLKPHVRIKNPWRLSIGDHSWIGQGTWIDNIEDVTLGSHVCISQLTYFCTGSHDHTKESFDLIAKPIVVHSGAWIAARSTILGGVEVGQNSVVAAGSLVNKDVPSEVIVGGLPARQIGRRE